MARDKSALKISNLDVHYKDFQALWDVSLEVARRRIVSVIGANGAGKSTLLNTISGVLTPSEGTIEFFGEAIGGLPPTIPSTKELRLSPREGGYSRGLRYSKILSWDPTHPGHGLNGMKPSRRSMSFSRFSNPVIIRWPIP